MICDGEKLLPKFFLFSLNFFNTYDEILYYVLVENCSIHKMLFFPVEDKRS